MAAGDFGYREHRSPYGMTHRSRFYVHGRCDDNIASRSGQGRVLEASDGHIVVDTFAQVDTSGDGYSGVGYTCLGIKCWL